MARPKAAVAKASTHFQRYEKHYPGVASAMPKADMNGCTNTTDAAKRLNRVYSALSNDTLTDVLRCMKSPKNEKFLAGLGIKTSRVSSFFSKIQKSE